MARRSQLVVGLVVAAIVGLTATEVILRNRLRCEGFAGAPPSPAELPPPADDPTLLRLVTWNLRNFPLDSRPQEPDLGYSRRTNICDLEAALGGLDADLMALCEVGDTRRFPPTLRRAGGRRPYREIHSERGGRFDQYLTLVWDASRLTKVGPHQELSALALDGELRPGLAATFRSRAADGVELTVLVVHLAAAPNGLASRRRQAAIIADWVAARPSSEAVVVLGDFNAAGGDRLSADDELAELDTVLAGAGLARLTNATGCSEYWEGPGRPDGVQVAALLDLVYQRGVALAGTDPAARSWLHCQRAACGELVSRVGAEDATFWDVSDHCPVTFEIVDRAPRR